MSHSGTSSYASPSPGLGRGGAGMQILQLYSIKFVERIAPAAFNPSECAAFSCGTSDALLGTDRSRLVWSRPQGPGIWDLEFT